MGKYKQSYKKGSKSYTENLIKEKEKKNMENTYSVDYVHHDTTTNAEVTNLSNENSNQYQWESNFSDAISNALSESLIDTADNIEPLEENKFQSYKPYTRNRYPAELVPEKEYNRIEINSRKAAYHEKAHNYDLNAYTNLIASGKSKEEAIELLKYFYENIDILHKNEPRFQKNGTSTIVTNSNNQRGKKNGSGWT